MRDALNHAKQLHARAVEEQNAGRPARALALLYRARKALEASESTTEEDDQLTRVWISIGYNSAECDGADAGLDVISYALARATSSRNLELVGKAYLQRAVIALRAGRLDLADVAFVEAESLHEHIGAFAQCTLFLNGGALKLLRHELGGAKRAFEQAAKFARVAQSPGVEFKAVHNLAYTEFLIGDLPLALRLMDEAGQLEVDVSRAVWLLDRARVLAAAGLVSEADRALTTAGEMLKRDRAFQDLAESELERARCALIGGDVQAARRLAGQARARFLRRGNEQWRRTAELVLLQADLEAGRPGARLVPPATRLRDELVTAGLRGPARTAGLIVVAATLAAGNTDAAAAELSVIGRESKSDPITDRLHAHYVRALVDARQRRAVQASKRIAKGLAELAEYQSNFGSLDLSTAAAIHGRWLADLDVELAVTSGKSEAIFDAAERGRSVTSRLAAVRPPEDDVTADLLAELRQVVESLRMVELNASASAPLILRRRELETQISQRAWRRQGERAVTAVASVADVAGHLAGASSTLVSYVLAGTELLAVVLDASGVRHLQLGAVPPIVEHVRRVRADLDVLAQPRLPEPIAAAVTSSWDRSAAALDDALIKPLGIDGRLVLVTTGLLGAIPWNALPSLRGVPVTVAPSATAWVTADGRGKRHSGRRIASLAGPGLARSTDEAGDVAAAWGTAKVFSGDTATGTNLSKSMATARVLHIAAHGTHQSENPLFSSLRLADGPLFAHELDQTAGTPDHVVLSACELGLATVRPGDEALGLTSVLLRLGTKSVVAGVARIGDDLAAETMGAYHRLLAAGQDSSAALAEATAKSDHPVPLVNFGATWHK